jgi:hypothetical protein
MEINETAKELETQELTTELSTEELDRVGGGLLGVDGTHN